MDWPVWLRNAVVDDFDSFSAEVVLSSVEQVQPENRENSEHKAQENAHVKKTRHGRYNRRHENFHRLQLADWFQRPEHASRTQRLQEARIEGRNEIQYADHDDGHDHYPDDDGGHDHFADDDDGDDHYVDDTDNGEYDVNDFDHNSDI